MVTKYNKLKEKAVEVSNKKKLFRWLHNLCIQLHNPFPKRLTCSIGPANYVQV